MMAWIIGMIGNVAIGISPERREMSFNYLKRFQELESHLSDYKIKYGECDSHTDDGFISGRQDFFLIKFRRHEPTFDEDLLGFMQVSKLLVRSDKQVFFALIKNRFDEAYNEAVQRRLSTGECRRLKITCT